MSDVHVISCACENCGASLTFEASSGGHIAECPECFAYVDVPCPDTVASTPAPDRQLLDEQLPIPLNVDIAFRFPRPRWEDFAAQLPSELSDEQLNGVYFTATRLWLTALQSQLPSNYSMACTRNFRVLCPMDQGEAEAFADFCEDCLATIHSLLPGIVADDGCGPHVVLAFAAPVDYYDYVCWYFPEGEYGGSSGMCIRNDFYHHIALHCVRAEWRSIVAHELTHILLSHLRLPLWLEEGLTQTVEERATGYSFATPTHALKAEQIEYWGQKSLEPFWDGSAFTLSDEGQGFAFALARIMFAVLNRDHSNEFADFVRAAQFVDGGESAARNILGRGVAGLTETFLGEGDWQPRGHYEIESPDAAQIPRSI